MSDAMNGKKDTILVASGDSRVSGHFQGVLATVYDVEVTADASGMLYRLKESDPSVLIIDPALYPEDTTDQIIAVVRMAADTHVVVIENSSNREINQHDLFKAGAHGFCKDDISESLLLKAVQLILDGDYWVQRKLITQVISDLAAERSAASTSSNFDRTLVNSLTPRELQVARMVHMGGNNKIIARELDISERTVKAHLSAIFRKLDIENRLNLALYFSEIR
jgi:two-component system nitrate/nitrite response regulator NarL